MDHSDEPTCVASDWITIEEVVAMQQSSTGTGAQPLGSQVGDVMGLNAPAQKGASGTVDVAHAQRRRGWLGLFGA